MRNRSYPYGIEVLIPLSIATVHAAIVMYLYSRSLALHLKAKRYENTAGYVFQKIAVIQDNMCQLVVLLSGMSSMK